MSITGAVQNSLQVGADNSIWLMGRQSHFRNAAKPLLHANNKMVLKGLKELSAYARSDDKLADHKRREETATLLFDIGCINKVISAMTKFVKQNSCNEEQSEVLYEGSTVLWFAIKNCSDIAQCSLQKTEFMAVVVRCLRNRRSHDNGMCLLVHLFVDRTHRGAMLLAREFVQEHNGVDLLTKRIFYFMPMGSLHKLSAILNGLSRFCKDDMKGNKDVERVVDRLEDVSLRALANVRAYREEMTSEATSWDNEVDLLLKTNALG